MEQKSASLSIKDNWRGRMDWAFSAGLSKGKWLWMWGFIRSAHDTELRGPCFISQPHNLEMIKNSSFSTFFLITGQLKTSHWFLQPIFLEWAHMKHILNHLSSWVLAPLSFCQHILLFVEIERQLHFLNSTTNKESKSPKVKSSPYHPVKSLRVSKAAFPLCTRCEHCRGAEVLGYECRYFSWGSWSHWFGTTSSTPIYRVITMSAPLLSSRTFSDGDFTWLLEEFKKELSRAGDTEVMVRIACKTAKNP